MSGWMKRQRKDRWINMWIKLERWINRTYTEIIYIQVVRILNISGLMTNVYVLQCGSRCTDRGTDW
jgi:hypothetical protein